MIHAHVRCDQCERMLVPLDDVSVTEEFVLDSRWIVLKWSEPYDDDESQDLSQDFCSLICAAHWCEQQAEAAPKETDDRAGA